jgi:DNA-binding IscR family transcriptional regulator
LRKVTGLTDPSPEVQAFIGAYIRSIDVLRVLLALAREPGRESTAGDIAHAVKLAPEVTARHLETLCAHGLAAVTSGTPPQYRYAPRADELNRMVQELVRLDNERPVTLIRLVYSTAQSSAEAFAEAFRLRNP